ncbi:MAG: ABC transporter permease [Planctomycetia bacterium]|jgi:lipoprotein-releasing system permease protein
MYKYLLCWRYLRTRYIALASVISVALGVATLIVVNSVMSGFTTEMQGRLHGILSDIVIDSRDFGGFKDPEARMEQIRKIAGDKIEAMTPTVTVPSMLYFKNKRGEWMSRPVQVIGIDMETYPLVSDFSKYLQHPEHREKPSFQLLEKGYDYRDHQLKEGEPYVPRKQLGESGWKYRRNWARCEKFSQQLNQSGMSTSSNATPEVRTIGPPNTVPHPNYTNPGNTASPPGAAIVSDAPTPEILRSSNNSNTAMTADPFAQGHNGFGPNPFDQRDGNQQNVYDPEKKQRAGIIIGMGLISARDHEGRDWFAAVPGDDVNLTVPTTGQPPEGMTDSFTVVDLYESKMSEYDSQLVFVPLDRIQQLRGMIDPVDPTRGRVNQIQIKLKPGVDAVAVRNLLRQNFDPRFFSVMTWMDLQGALLQAVEVERAILNLLLFLIIAVAGFGILAIFLMIVIEKTRDIGILKSLGASRIGIMGIFLNYGVLLGVVGSGVGVGLGLALVYNINKVADYLSYLRGQPIFDPSVYYFYRIPTIVDPMMIVQVVGGTLLIAILASIAPALRAAFMHPVEALRHE